METAAPSRDIPYSAAIRSDPSSPTYRTGNHPRTIPKIRSSHAQNPRLLCQAARSTYASLLISYNASAGTPAGGSDGEIPK